MHFRSALVSYFGNDLNQDGSTTLKSPFQTIENVLVIDIDALAQALAAKKKWVLSPINSGQ